MDLTTRCPQCGTSFSASLAQLQLRKGYIRCVQCAHIFDGYEAVVGPEAGSGRPESGHTIPDAPASGPASAAPDSVAAPHLFTPSVVRVRGRREFTISDPDRDVGSTAEPFLGGADVPLSDDPEGDTTGFSVHVAPGRADDYADLEPAGRDNVERYADLWRESASDEASGWWRSLISLFWLLVLVAGIVVFVVQLVYVFRVQIAENVPAVRPALERMCETLDCTVAYSRQIDMIVITHSSLQQNADTSENGDETAVLQFTLRNVHDLPQEWPTLVLDVKDFSGALIARKHLPKNVYLPSGMEQAPFQANSELAVALPLMVQDLDVNGFQLTKFFP